MEALKFSLEVYEGPLDLLLSLITKNKLNIYDIPIALILEQYMAYLEEMARLDMEIAGEFIVMASELMLIKSRMLLPKPEPEEEEEDPRAKLTRALLEYQKAKEAAAYLSGQYELYAGRIVKDTEIFDRTKEIPESMDCALLRRAFEKMLLRNSEMPRLAQESESAIKSLIKTRMVPVSEKVLTVMRTLLRGDKPFDALFRRVGSRSELVATFLAILELVKVQRVVVTEQENGELLLHLDKTHKHESVTADGTT